MTSRLAQVAEKAVEPNECLSLGLHPAEFGSEAALGIIPLKEKDRESSAASQLSCLSQQFRDVTDQASKLLSLRSEQELSRRPQPDSWSVAECIDHVALTTRTFCPEMWAAIATAPKLDSRRALRTSRLTRLLIRALEPPYRLRHRVLACLVPQTHDFSLAWSGFLDSQAQLANLIHSCTGLAIDQVRIQSPACTQVSYTVYGALGILAAHQRRHMWQVERILGALELLPSEPHAGEAS
jgi:hypothetical protein